MGVSYTDFISAVTNYYNAEAGIPPTAQWGSSTTWSTISTDMARVGITSDNYINYLENFPELFDITRNVDGTVLDSSLKKYMYYGNVSGYNAGTGGALNSNKIPSTFSESTGLNISGIATKSTTGVLTKGGIGLKADTGLTAQGVISTIGIGVLGVGVGATLGKIVGDGLYNANPDFWDSGKVSKLSETDWNKFAIAVKDDIGTLKNKGLLALWGVDNDTTTMYVDENAIAYMTWYLAQQGIFNQSGTGSATSGDTGLTSPLPEPIEFYTGNTLYFNNDYNSYLHDVSGSSYKILTQISPTGGGINYMACSLTPFVYSQYLDGSNPSEAGKSTYNGVDFYTVFIQTGGRVKETNAPINYGSVYSNNYLRVCEIVLFGDVKISQTIDGISDNPNSTQFNPTGVGSVATALGALKNQYPDLWNNSIKRKTIQDDGSEDERTYVPIPIPKYNNPFDEKPTTGTPSQTQPSVSPETTPKDELDNVSDTNTKDPTESDNPNTGGGDSPSIIVPTQQASALWAIYNPTLAQLNSLGAWLWSSNFIDQLLKIFNDPMQAIIGLHKVYATPSISGSGNIKVGYLDSGVPSNIVGNQYTYIDCGSVSLREYYGNVLDYSPYTTVQLYLPFIGIVSLDIADVSRSTISIRYGVDVLTGACLASVSVQRDNAGGVLYQYSGNCACQYPLSSGSYMGMVTGAIGTLGSLARGNIFGTAMGIAGMHTNIEHSGGFSGNAGAMGIKKPYLIISRPQSVINDGFPSIQGYPSNYYTRLGNCSGFTQVAECHVENIPATDKELDKIKDLLKEGVIL